MIPNVDIQLMRPENLQLLHAFCCDAYSQNFAHHWEEGGLENYLDDVFGTEKLRTELLNNNIQYYVAFIEEQPVAFMKLNLASNLLGLNADEGIELDKVYILPAFKGKRIGKILLDKAFERAKFNKKKIFWLCVIDANTEAISFYKKNGFKLHSKARVNYPKFKEELKGMWRMFFELS
jgi:ribosomal protein S18 acetylase RimI-like enzyme